MTPPGPDVPLAVTFVPDLTAALHLGVARGSDDRCSDRHHERGRRTGERVHLALDRRRRVLLVVLVLIIVLTVDVDANGIDVTVTLEALHFDAIALGKISKGPGRIPVAEEHRERIALDDP